jgi:hypothetical protein
LCSSGRLSAIVALPSLSIIERIFSAIVMHPVFAWVAA